MQTHALAEANPNYRRDLGDGLVLRWSSERDADEIAHLTSTVFRWGKTAPANEPLAILMQQALHGNYPVMGPGDVAVVEDTRRREHPLVASSCLWRQFWSYGGIPFAIGRPEIIATDEGYRNRGLVRALLSIVHARSEAEGHLAQGITGIPYFYRQFGYEYALDLDIDRVTLLPLIPLLAEGKAEPFTFREATLADLPSLRTWYEQQLSSYVVTTPFDEQWWSYQIASMTDSVLRAADGHWHVLIIQNAEGQPCGYIAHNTMRWRASLGVSDVGTAPGLNLQTLAPSLLRELARRGASLPAPPNSQEMKSITFRMGNNHPLYAVLGKSLALEQDIPYAWYVRVPNVPAFLRHIAPVLEQRLARSPLAGYSDTLHLNFYRGGLRLVFEQGKLTAAEDWQAPAWDSPEKAGFPPLVFLQLLFGHRSLDSLRSTFHDVRANEDAVPLLNALFPEGVSWVLPLG